MWNLLLGYFSAVEFRENSTLHQYREIPGLVSSVRTQYYTNTGRSLGWEDPLEVDMETHWSFLVWIIPWTEEPGWPWFIGSKRVRHNWSDLACKHTLSPQSPDPWPQALSGIYSPLSLPHHWPPTQVLSHPHYSSLYLTQTKLLGGLGKADARELYFGNCGPRLFYFHKINVFEYLT